MIIYKVTLESPDHKVFDGVYTFTVKGAEVRKFLKMENGFEDIVVINGAKNTIYSLKSSNGRKYAIQLSMAELQKRQEKYSGFTITNEETNSTNIAGFAAYKGNAQYSDKSSAEVYYTKDWYPAQKLYFERFPDAKFLPLVFSMADEHGIVMHFTVESISAAPVENAIFRIPPDYKMISYTEYQKFNK